MSYFIVFSLRIWYNKTNKNCVISVFFGSLLVGEAHSVARMGFKRSQVQFLSPRPLIKPSAIVFVEDFCFVCNPVCNPVSHLIAFLGFRLHFAKCAFFLFSCTDRVRLPADETSIIFFRKYFKKLLTLHLYRCIL